MNRKTISILMLMLGAMLLVPGSAIKAQFKSDDILGIWLNQDKDAHIELFKRGDKIFGKIVWLKDPIDPDTGKPKVDKHNPDPALRSRPSLGLEILKGFTFNGKTEWSGGEIYDPKSGKTYSSYMNFDGNNKDVLKLRGYIGISLIGRTNTWTRVK